MNSAIEQKVNQWLNGSFDDDTKQQIRSLQQSQPDDLADAFYRNLEFDMNAFTRRHSGTLRIGASTTVAQYVLPPVLAAFHKKFT